MRMINSQQHKFSCGIVAITNVLKDQGYKVSYCEVYKQISKSKCYDSSRGINVEDIMYILGKAHFFYSYSRRIKPKSIIQYRVISGQNHYCYLDASSKLYNTPRTMRFIKANLVSCINF